MFAFFQSRGTSPICNESEKNRCRNGAISWAAFFNTQQGIWSGPAALLTSRLLNSFAIGHVRYINIRARLRGFRVKIANFSSFLCPSIPKRDLDTKKTTPNIEVWPESLGAMLECWYIERGLLRNIGLAGYFFSLSPNLTKVPFLSFQMEYRPIFSQYRTHSFSKTHVYIYACTEFLHPYLMFRSRSPNEMQW